LTDQKGLDLVAYIMEELLCTAKIQIIVLGTGEDRYEEMFRYFENKYPNQIKAYIGYSEELAHRIYASCDSFLMPSLFEPCGLSQLMSMRYGTLPIVRETGGLKDTVIPYNEYTGEGTGFSFANYNADEMLHVIYYAMDIYYNRRDEWNAIVSNGMRADFSWDVSADKYINMYRELTGIYDAPAENNALNEEDFREKLDIDIKKTEEALFGETEKAKPAKKPAAKKTAAKKTQTKKKTTTTRKAKTKSE